MNGHAYIFYNYCESDSQNRYFPEDMKQAKKIHLHKNAARN